MFESIYMLASLITGFGRPFALSEPRSTIRNMSNESLFQKGRDVYDKSCDFAQLAETYDCQNPSNCPDHPNLSWSGHTSQRHMHEYDHYLQLQIYDRITRELMRRRRQDLV